VLFRVVRVISGYAFLLTNQKQICIPAISKQRWNPSCFVFFFVCFVHFVVRFVRLTTKHTKHTNAHDGLDKKKHTNHTKQHEKETLLCAYEGGCAVCRVSVITCGFCRSLVGGTLVSDVEITKGFSLHLARCSSISPFNLSGMN
jgi:hypothetical protein